MNARLPPNIVPFSAGATAAIAVNLLIMYLLLFTDAGTGGAAQHICVQLGCLVSWLVFWLFFVCREYTRSRSPDLREMMAELLRKGNCSSTVVAGVGLFIFVFSSTFSLSLVPQAPDAGSPLPVWQLVFLAGQWLYLACLGAQSDLLIDAAQRELAADPEDGPRAWGHVPDQPAVAIWLE